MKTVFVHGLFPTRNQVFFEYLCNNFNVYTFRDIGFNSSATCKWRYAEDILGNTINIDASKFKKEMAKGLAFTKLQLLKFFSTSNSHTDYNEEIIKTAHSVSDKDILDVLEIPCLTFFKYAAIFNAFAAKIKIDMVIVSSDYDSFRRFIVIEARQLGIPTFNIEHGYSAPHPLSDAYRYFIIDYLSDFVNFDSELDVEYCKNFLQYDKQKSRTKFLALGTPQDAEADISLTRDNAITLLGLNNKKKVITLTGTWEEARNSNLIEAITSTIDHYKNVFQSLATFPGIDNIQIIVKLHPTFVESEVFETTKNCLDKLSYDTGLKIDLISAVNFKEILAATDVMVALGVSAILWDNFLVGNPGIVFPSQNQLKNFKDPDNFHTDSLLYQAGCIKMAGDKNKLLQYIQEYLSSDITMQINNARKVLKNKYNFRNQTVQEKSQNICNWINDYLSDK
ncbi:MAG: hypothetical protein HQK83_09755 [Fibrobacteria bacterium]|nr:hypothetical protein [Fibrobacteria bacterium]